MAYNSIKQNTNHIRRSLNTDRLKFSTNPDPASPELALQALVKPITSSLRQIFLLYAIEKYLENNNLVNNTINSKDL